MSITPATPLPPELSQFKQLIDFLQWKVQPPSLFYITRDDVIQITVAAPIVNTVVQISWRFLSPDGQVLPFFETFTVTATAGTPFVKKYQNAEGFMLSMSVYTPNAPYGQAFISVAVRRGGGSADVTTGDIFLQGYPGQVGGIAYPQSRIRSPFDGRGRMRSIAMTNPAAGADWTTTVPAGVAWIVRGVTAQLDTSVAVATRAVTLQFLDSSANLLLDSIGGATEVASIDDVYSWFNGGQASFEGLVISGGLPAEFRLPAGWVIRSATANIDAGDQWSKIVLTVEEFIGG